MATVANADGGDVNGAVRVTDDPLTDYNRENAGDPQGSVTPEYKGEIILDTTNGAYYVATDLTSDSWIPATRVV